MAVTAVADARVVREEQELRALLREAGILRATSAEPIVHRDGRPAPWAFYSWNVTLGERGLRLAARAILRRLETFRSTQIAGHGYTAIPLVAGCVLEGGGRYDGLAIRDKPKPYLARRRIDGRKDTSRSVVVVDDSLSSGTSLGKAIGALEEDGFEVEGAVALVHFPYRGGAEWAYGHGYRVETVFDVWADLEMADPAPPPGWAHVGPADGPRVPSGLPVATAARRAAEIYLRTGLVPRPPESVEDAPADSSGGVFVSFRERGTERRLARDGFWHFDPGRASLPRDLVAATVRTVRSSGGAVNGRTLAGLKVGVTCLGALESVQPSGLDFARYGIVVRDATFGRKLGGALPNTQVFVSEIEQLGQARFRNAKLSPTEPFELFRHEVTKHVEPGESWLPYGKPDGPELAWSEDPEVAAAVTRRVRRLLAALAGAEAAPESARLAEDVVPYELEGAAVAVYRDGLLGSGICEARRPLDELLSEAAATAFAQLDDAARDDLRDGGGGLSIVTTLLHDREEHGRSAAVAAWKTRRGLDSVTLESGGRRFTALPAALPYNNWTARDLVRELGRGHDGAPARWSTCRTTSWLAQGTRTQRLLFGFTRGGSDPGSAEAHRETAELLAGYLARNVGPDGLPVYQLDPVSDTAVGTRTAARVVHGLAMLLEAGKVLDRPDYEALGLAGLEHCLDHVRVTERGGTLALPASVNGTIGDCVLLTAAAADPRLRRHPAVPLLARRLRPLLREDGRVCEHRVRLGLRQDHDFLPGAALVALAACSRHLGDPLPKALPSALRWHRGRFRLLGSWGMAGWQPQAWAAFAELTGAEDQIAFVHEVADWAIRHQLEKNGTFLEDLSPDEPSFDTGFVAEGVAAAWRLAVYTGDEERATRYRHSWSRALDFVATLVVRPEDTFPFAHPTRAVGGVRTSLSRSDVRVDAVSHCLHACLTGLPILGEGADASAAGIR